MKTRNAFSSAVLIARYYLVKLAMILLHPMKSIPSLDFNNQYDSTIL